MLKHSRHQIGQLLPVTMGLMAIAAVSLFLVFNSHRAVDQKIHLVNAADATVYSGAQMAARQLNFMALTNRAMIANEVAIGHMMAYQTEVDLVVDGVTTGLGGLIGVIINAIVSAIGAPALDVAQQLSQAFSGAYILAVNATNQLYADYQEEEFRALAGIGRKQSVIDDAMQTVAAQYILNPNVEIAVNSSDALSDFAADGDEKRQAISKVAGENNSKFCALVMFAKPTNTAAQNIYARFPNTADPEDYKAGSVWRDCEEYYANRTVAEQEAETNGTPVVYPSEPGILTTPEEDGGVMLSLLNATANNVPSSTWVVNRDLDYSLAGRSVERRGSSSAVWDASINQLNWKTNGDDTLKTRFWSLILTINAKASGDAKFLADQAVNVLGDALTLLESTSLCDEIDCASLAVSSYTGMRQYAILNPQMGDFSDPLSIAALLSQQSGCNDDVGIDEDGNPIDGFNKSSRLGGFKNCSAKTSYAFAQAEVFYQRPVCTGSTCTSDIGFDGEGVSGEKRNLFNPFWQARLISDCVKNEEGVCIE